jgi:hypothetical protein
MNALKEWFGLMIFNYHFTYDDNHKRLFSMSQFWNGFSWEDYELNTYTYDSSNNITKF